MLESAAASLRDGEPEALGRVLDSLSALQVSMGADAAAAASFEELKTILDGLQRSLPDRVQVRILLAEAQLRAGKRSAGVAELRQAAYLAEAADPPVDVEAVEALCRLARALVDDADDRARALDVLELAEALNDRLYALDEPQTDALPALASTVHDIRGVEAALAIVQAALRRVPNGFGAFVALHADARFDVYHFEEVSEIPDEEDDGPLDPGTLLLVLNKLARLCHGEALDPQTGELLE